MSIFKAYLVTICFLQYVSFVEIEVLLWNVEYSMMSEFTSGCDYLWMAGRRYSGETKGREL